MIRPRLPIPTVISPLKLLPDPSRAIVKRQTFMPFFNGYTILMWVVCLVLVGMALTLLFSSHDHLCIHHGCRLTASLPDRKQQQSVSGGKFFCRNAPKYVLGVVCPFVKHSHRSVLQYDG